MRASLSEPSPRVIIDTGCPGNRPTEVEPPNSMRSTMRVLAYEAHAVAYASVLGSEGDRGAEHAEHTPVLVYEAHAVMDQGTRH